MKPALLVQVDGTPGRVPRGTAGIGIVVRSANGRLLTTRSVRAPATTNNEAEYQAIIAGLGLMLRAFPGTPVCCMSDSRIAIDQLNGKAMVRAPALQPLHQRATALAQHVGSVVFCFIPRELNQLADALAWEALDGRGWIVRSSQSGGGHHEP